MADEENNEIKLESKPPGAKNPLLTALLLVNTLMMGAVAYFQYQSFLKISTKESVQDIVRSQAKSGEVPHEEDFLEGEAKKVEGFPIPLEPFTANLAQGDGPRRFVRLNVVLNFSNESSRDEITARTPQIRDTVISILNSKRPEDLLMAEGKNYLKEELKSAINTFLVNGHVLDIYYVGFQVN